MSIHTLTLDEFSQLDLWHHRTAVRLYSAEIDGLITSLAAMEDKSSPAYLSGSDELGRLLTLRKLHQVRLDELEAEPAAPAPRLAPLPAPFTALHQYAENEREPALA